MDRGAEKSLCDNDIRLLKQAIAAVETAMNHWLSGQLSSFEFACAESEFSNLIESVGLSELPPKPMVRELVDQLQVTWRKVTHYGNVAELLHKHRIAGDEGGEIRRISVLHSNTAEIEPTKNPFSI